MIAESNLRSDCRPPQRQVESDTGSQSRYGEVETSEQAKRETRAARFTKNATIDARATMNCVEVCDDTPVIGTLDRMCSLAEAQRREASHQLDIFEQRRECQGDRYAFVTKKYERSSAGKGYQGDDIRTMNACWATVCFLVSKVLALDESRAIDIAAADVQYSQIYSYMHDRLRAVRVDLLVQQPHSTTGRQFIESHECCIRFELLSRFLFNNCCDVGAPGHFVEKLSTEALSQTIEPLLHAYREAHHQELCCDIRRQAQQLPYISKDEMVMHRYVILLMLGSSCEKLVEHLATLPSRVLKHPLITFALDVVAAFHADNHSRVLRFYTEADFLTAVAMSSIVDFSRSRTLWLIFQAYPKSVGDRLSLRRLKNMLAFANIKDLRQFLVTHQVQIIEGDESIEEEDKKACLPKKGSPDAEAHPLLTSREPSLTTKSECRDALLVKKFQELKLDRSAIVFGSADPAI